MPFLFLSAGYIEEGQNISIRVSDVKLFSVRHHTKWLNDIDIFGRYRLIKAIQIGYTENDINILVLTLPFLFFFAWRPIPVLYYAWKRL